jgi:hypothetical protein
MRPTADARRIEHRRRVDLRAVHAHAQRNACSARSGMPRRHDLSQLQFGRLRRPRADRGAEPRFAG